MFPTVFDNIMAIMISLSTVDRGFETKDYKDVICCFTDNHAS